MMAEKIRDCAAVSPTSAKDQSCADIAQWVSEELPKIVSLARGALALAHSTSQRGSMRSQDEVLLNSSLNEKKSFKATPWQPLNAEEAPAIAKNFEMLKDEARKTASGQVLPIRTIPDDLYRSELLKMRHTFYMIYLSYMGITPLLQFIRSSKPSAAEISTAAKRVLSSLANENALLSKIENKLKNPEVTGPRKIKEFDPSILSLLNYRAEVEEVLRENPAFCGLGVSLQQIKGNQELVPIVLVGLPVMAASFWLPPAWALAAGLTTTATVVAKQQDVYTQSFDRETSRVQRKGYSDFKETLNNKPLAQLRDELNKDVTRVYRSQLQDIRNDEVNRNVSLIVVPAATTAPAALKIISGFSSSLRAAAWVQK
jgi:hypothetical protein